MCLFPPTSATLLLGSAPGVSLSNTSGLTPRPGSQGPCTPPQWNSTRAVLVSMSQDLLCSLTFGQLQSLTTVTGRGGNHSLICRGFLISCSSNSLALESRGPKFGLERIASGLSEVHLEIVSSPPLPFLLSPSLSSSFFCHEDCVCNGSWCGILAVITLTPRLALLAVLVLGPAGHCGVFI